MADSPEQVADDLAGMGAVVRAETSAALGDQADESRRRMAADTPRDRNVTAEAWVTEVRDGGMTHRVTNTATDPKGRYIATILEYGYNDGRPDAIVEREFARVEERVGEDVMDAVVKRLP